MDKTACVTGGAGFIGSHIVEYLISQGWFVTVIDDLSSGKKENLSHCNSDQYLLCIGDIRDSDFISNIFKEHSFTAVFHEAAIASVQRSLAEPEMTYDVNVTGARHVFNASIETGVNFVAFASSAAVYGDNPVLPKTEDMFPSPISPYGEHKLQNENDAQQFSQKGNTRFTGLRYFNVFGERQDPGSEYSGVISIFTSKLAHRNPITIYGDGEQTRDFIYVRDIVNANMAAFQHAGSGFNVYNVGRGEALSLNRLVETLFELYGYRVDVNYDLPREGDIRHSCSNIHRIRVDCGFNPDYSAKEGLRQLINHGY